MNPIEILKMMAQLESENIESADVKDLEPQRVYPLGNDFENVLKDIALHFKDILFKCSKVYDSEKLCRIVRSVHGNLIIGIVEGVTNLNDVVNNYISKSIKDLEVDAIKDYSKYLVIKTDNSMELICVNKRSKPYTSDTKEVFLFDDLIIAYRLDTDDIAIRIKESNISVQSSDNFIIRTELNEDIYLDYVVRVNGEVAHVTSV